MALALSAGGAARAASCGDTLGAERSAILVDQCLAVSPATRPPCNARNDCAMMIDEIKRSCALIDKDRPGFCKPYLAGASFVPPEPVHARPGFDCARATSAVETAICASEQLADEDRAMTERFGARAKKATDATALRQEQRAFLQERGHCADPEPGRSADQSRRITGSCIEALTTERIAALGDGAGGRTWDVFPGDATPVKTCLMRFGADGSDAIEIERRAGDAVAAQLRFVEFVFRLPAILQPGDQGSFDVDGVAFAATVTIPTEPDGLPEIAATGASATWLRALAAGRMLRVKRNGKVIFRAPLASFAAADAQVRRDCGLPPRSGGG